MSKGEWVGEGEWGFEIFLEIFLDHEDFTFDFL